MGLWIEEYPKSIQQILRVLALNRPLKASEISRITGFHRQTVYKDLAKLSEAGLIKGSGEKKNQFSLSDKVDPDQILTFFETEDKYGIFTINGESLDSIHVPGKFRATFFDSTFLPVKTVYGCRTYLETISKSTIAMFRTFTDMLKNLHYRLEEVYWTIDAYSSSDGADFGVGIDSFIKTISDERGQKKAAVNVSFAVQDWFGGYYGLMYNIQARWTSQDLNKGILDQIKLHVVLDKIPIGKKFAISWSEAGLLPFVEEFIVNKEIVIDTKIQLSQDQIIGFVDRFGHEIIFHIPSKGGLPTKILARMYDAGMTLEDLRTERPLHLGVVRYRINPRSVDSSIVRLGHSEIKLICAIISD